MGHRGLIRGQDRGRRITLTSVPFQISNRLNTRPTCQRPSIRSISILVLSQLRPTRRTLTSFFDILIMVAQRIMNFRGRLRHISINRQRVIGQRITSRLPRRITIRQQHMAQHNQNSITRARRLQHLFTHLTSITRLRLTQRILINTRRLSQRNFIHFNITSTRTRMNIRTIVRQQQALTSTMVQATIKRIRAQIILRQFRQRMFLVARTTELPSHSNFRKRRTTIFRIMFNQRRRMFILLTVRTGQRHVILRRISS